MVYWTWIRLNRRGECIVYNAVAHLRKAEVETFCLFLRVKFARYDIEQQHFDADVGEMAGNARAHNARAEYGNFTDWSVHSR